MKKSLLITLALLSFSAHAESSKIEPWKVVGNFAMAETGLIYSVQLHRYSNSCKTFISLSYNGLDIPEVINVNGQDVNVEYGGKNRWVRFLTPKSKHGNDFLFNQFKHKKQVTVIAGDEERTYSAMGFSKAASKLYQDCKKSLARKQKAL